MAVVWDQGLGGPAGGNLASRPSARRVGAHSLRPATSHAASLIRSKAAFYGSVCFMVFDKCGGVDSSGVAFNSIDILQNVFKSPNRVAGRHVSRRIQPATVHEASGFPPH